MGKVQKLPATKLPALKLPAQSYLLQRYTTGLKLGDALLIYALIQDLSLCISVIAIYMLRIKYG